MDQEELKKRYDSTRAASYDAERKHDSRWEMEHRAVATFLSRLGPGSSVLDVPVGTGRFISLYRDLGIAATGVDASASMLREAVALATELATEIQLSQGDLFSLDFPASSFDAVVCMRFLNWIDSSDLERAMRELARVSRTHLIIAVEEYIPLSQFHFFHLRDYRRCALQIKRRFFMWRSTGDYVYHRAGEVRRAFLRCNLEVVEHVRIPRKRDEGIAYRVFLLCKT